MNEKRRDVVCIACMYPLISSDPLVDSAPPQWTDYPAGPSHSYVLSRRNNACYPWISHIRLGPCFNFCSSGLAGLDSANRRARPPSFPSTHSISQDRWLSILLSSPAGHLNSSSSCSNLRVYSRHVHRFFTHPSDK